MTRPDGDLLVIGIGNILLRDEGVGVRVAELLQRAEAAAAAPAGRAPEASNRAEATTAGALPLGNDLWPAATVLRPELAALEEALRSLLERPLVLSGSGPTLVALYPSTVEAAAAAARLERAATPALAGVEIIATSSSQSQREQRG